jgi:dynactin complex subunit
LSDIVERLRHWTGPRALVPLQGRTAIQSFLADVVEAADEIEKLRLMPDDNRAQLMNLAKQHQVLLDENERLRKELEKRNALETHGVPLS